MFDNKIKIPIVFFELMHRGKFPIYMLNHHEVKIRFVSCIKAIDKLKGKMTYKYSMIPRKYEQMAKIFMGNLELIMIQTQNIPIPFKKWIELDKYNFNHVGQMLLFELIPSNDYIIPSVDKVELLLANANPPIVYDASMGEVFSFDILGKVVYGISFNPTYKTLDDVKNIFLTSSNV